MNMPDKRFQRELGQNASFSDGTISAISAEHSHEDAIYFHEHMHDSIFQCTPDGRIQKMLAAIAIKPASLQEGRKLKIINDMMVSRTIIAHERAATYVGIVSLKDIKSIDQNVAALPTEYLVYYKFFDDVFRDAIKSQTLKELACTVVTIAAFSSPIWLHINEENWLDVGFYQSFKSPSERMEIWMNNLGKEGIRKWIDKASQDWSERRMRFVVSGELDGDENICNKFKDDLDLSASYTSEVGKVLTKNFIDIAQTPDTKCIKWNNNIFVSNLMKRSNYNVPIIEKWHPENNQKGVDNLTHSTLRYLAYKADHTFLVDTYLLQGFDFSPEEFINEVRDWKHIEIQVIILIKNDRSAYIFLYGLSGVENSRPLVGEGNPRRVNYEQLKFIIEHLKYNHEKFRNIAPVFIISTTPPGEHFNGRYNWPQFLDEIGLHEIGLSKLDTGIKNESLEIIRLVYAAECFGKITANAAGEYAEKAFPLLDNNRGAGECRLFTFCPNDGLETYFKFFPNSMTGAIERILNARVLDSAIMKRSLRLSPKMILAFMSVLYTFETL